MSETLDPFADKKVDTGHDMVLPALTALMKVELVISKDRDIWILHDRPFDGILHWIEFDAAFQSMTLVMRDGRIQDTGLTINDKVAQFIKDGAPVYTILTNGPKIKDMYLVPIVVRY